MKEVLDRVQEIKNQYGNAPQCYLVAILLATKFQGEIWYNHDHCITRVEDGFYDRHGNVGDRGLSLKNYIPLDGIEAEHRLIVAMIEWLTFQD